MKGLGGALNKQIKLPLANWGPKEQPGGHPTFMGHPPPNLAQKQANKKTAPGKNPRGGEFPPGENPLGEPPKGNPLGGQKWPQKSPPGPQKPGRYPTEPENTLCPREERGAPAKGALHSPRQNVAPPGGRPPTRERARHNRE